MNSKSFIYEDREIKEVGLFGLGRSNLGVFTYLKEKFPHLKFTLRQDKQPDRLPPGIDRVFYGRCVCDSIREDILFISPSARRDRYPITYIKTMGTILCSDAELFFSRFKGRVFGVTGSDGKSTTTTLAQRLLSTKHNAVAVGNIGEAMTPHINDAETLIAAELSSFQLNYLAPPCYRALITNISKNHLNWHTSYEEYISAKARILENTQQPIFNYDCPESVCLMKNYSPFAVISRCLSFEELKNTVGASLYFTEIDGDIRINGKCVLKAQSLKLQGTHNIYNFLCAMALCYGEYENEALVSLAESFAGLAHRAELIGSFRGVRYVNSSIDSSPKRTVATLNSQNEKVILILGGRSKGLDFSELCPAVAEHARAVIITGENREEIFSALCLHPYMPRIYVYEDFFYAIDRAAEIACEGDTVLLSPASTSYDRFKSFEERGDSFRKYVTEKYRD